MVVLLDAAAPECQAGRDDYSARRMLEYFIPPNELNHSVQDAM
jgi:hypothetical protein